MKSHFPETQSPNGGMNKTYLPGEESLSAVSSDSVQPEACVSATLCGNFVSMCASVCVSVCVCGCFVCSNLSNIFSFSKYL